MKVIDTKYEIGQSVWLVTDVDQLERKVFAYIVYPESVMYKLACGTINSDHYDFEIQEEPNNVKKCQ